MRWTRYIALLLSCWLAVSAGCKKQQPTPPVTLPNPNGATTTGNTADLSKAPAYVWEVLAYVKEHQKAPAGFVGGRTFENREKKLPRTGTDGNQLQYREWDVHPKEKGVNRGPERLVTGNDKSAWYTADHYRTFKRIE